MTPSRKRPLGRHALTLWTQIQDPAEISAKLAELYEERLDLGNALTHAVRQARRIGLSWNQIGAELLMSKQAAWEKWHHVDPTDEPTLSPDLTDAALRLAGEDV